MAKKGNFEVNPECIFELASKPEVDQHEDSGEFYLKAIGVRSEKIPVGRQLLVATGPTILAVLSGLTSGYSAILLPQLKASNGTFDITEEEESWIAALAALPMIIGCILGGVLMEMLGRKMSLMITCIPFSIGWLLFCFAKGTGLIMVGRFITGAMCGLIAPPSTVYIGESTDPKYRGILLAGLSLGIAFGVLWAHVMGTFLTWRIVGGVCSIVPLLCMIQMYYVPESPTWLAKKDKAYQARMAFHWIRGNSKNAEKELERMLESSKKESAKKMTLKENARLVLTPVFLKPFMILSLYMTTTQWSGNNAITFYTVSIVNQTMGEEINEYLCMIVVDIVRMVLSILSCYLIEKMGRRPLTFVSGFGSAASLLGLALVTFLNTKSSEIPPVIALILLASFMAFVTVGLVAVPWGLVGEIFPLQVRGLGSGAVSVVAFLMMFLVVKTGPFMFSNLGSVLTYLFYGGTCLIGTGILCFVLPETKGKILMDIEDDFKQDRNNSINA